MTETKRDTDPTCSTCRWWDGLTTTGKCRRYPPRPAQDDGTESDAVWLFTRADEWCGEHTTRTPATADRPMRTRGRP